MRFSVLLKRRCALDGVVGRSSEVMMRVELTMQHDGNNTIIIIMILSVTTFVQQHEHCWAAIPSGVITFRMHLHFSSHICVQRRRINSVTNKSQWNKASSMTQKCQDHNNNFIQNCICTFQRLGRQNIKQLAHGWLPRSFHCINNILMRFLLLLYQCNLFRVLCWQ